MSGTLLSSLHASRTSFNFSRFCLLTKTIRGISEKRVLAQHPITSTPRKTTNMPPKRKRSSVADAATPANEIPTVLHETPIPPPNLSGKPPAPKRQASRRGKFDTNPDHNTDIVDGKTALRASPDADEKGEAFDIQKVKNRPATPAKTNGVNGAVKEEESDSPLSELELPVPAPSKKQKKSPTKSSIAAKKGSDEIKAFKSEQAARKAAEAKIKKEDDVDEWEKRLDPDGDDTGPAEDIDVMKKEAARPPPVNSDYLPLPWKGRLGYVRISSSGKGFRWLIIVIAGMSEYLPPILKSTNLHFSNLPHSIHPGAPPSPERSHATRTCHQEPSG
jgi:UV DNA damage endonuclease